MNKEDIYMSMNEEDIDELQRKMRKLIRLLDDSDDETDSKATVEQPIEKGTIDKRLQTIFYILDTDEDECSKLKQTIRYLEKQKQTNEEYIAKNQHASDLLNELVAKESDEQNGFKFMTYIQDTLKYIKDEIKKIKSDLKDLHNTLRECKKKGGRKKTSKSRNKRNKSRKRK